MDAKKLYAINHVRKKIAACPKTEFTSGDIMPDRGSTVYMGLNALVEMGEIELLDVRKIRLKTGGASRAKYYRTTDKFTLLKAKPDPDQLAGWKRYMPHLFVAPSFPKHLIVSDKVYKALV